MARTQNSLTNEQLDTIAETIAKAVIGDKRTEDIARLDQDEIDAKLFPIMQQLEDRVDERLTKIIEEVFERNIAAGNGRNWWDD